MRESKDRGLPLDEASLLLRDALKKAQAGDERGFTVLYNSYNSRLIRFAYSRTYSSSVDAEEIVAETWLSVAKDIHKFKGDATDFVAWLYTITRHRIIDAVRVRDRQVRATVEVSDIVGHPSKDNVEARFEEDEKVIEVIKLINKLPTAQAEVLMLRIISDLSVEETAKIIKKNSNAVRVLAHRGLTSLRAELSSDIIEGGLPK